MIANKEKIKILTALRKNINKNQYPLGYKDDFDFYNKNPNFNCYAYSLGLKIPNRYLGLKWEGLSIYNPGTISKFELIIYDEKTLMESFLADCDVLGFDVKNSINNHLNDESFNVALYIEQKKNVLFRDFHFIRQNRDGTWSNMKSAGGNVEIIDNLEIPSYNYLKTYTLTKKK